MLNISQMETCILMITCAQRSTAFGVYRSTCQSCIMVLGRLITMCGRQAIVDNNAGLASYWMGYIDEAQPSNCCCSSDADQRVLVDQ